jgi:cytochrome P450
MLGICDGPFHEWRRLTMAAVDGADHERKRSLVARAFTPRRVERLQLRPGTWCLIPRLMCVAS